MGSEARVPKMGCSLMHTTLNNRASSGSSINTTLHQNNNDTHTILLVFLSHEPWPTPTDCQGHTPTHQICTKSDALIYDAMLE